MHPCILLYIKLRYNIRRIRHSPPNFDKIPTKLCDYHRVSFSVFFFLHYKFVYFPSSATGFDRVRAAYFFVIATNKFMYVYIIFFSPLTERSNSTFSNPSRGRSNDNDRFRCTHNSNRICKVILTCGKQKKKKNRGNL
jgi:hypothetical protein